MLYASYFNSNIVILYLMSILTVDDSVIAYIHCSCNAIFLIILYITCLPCSLRSSSHLLIVQLFNSLSSPGHPQSVPITVRPAAVFPLDVYFLMDFSGSMADDLATVQSVAGDIGEMFVTCRACRVCKVRNAS